MGGQFPSIVPEALCHLGCLSAVFLIGRTVAVGGSGSVPQDALVTGKSQNSTRSPVGKIRVLFNKILQNRHQIVGASGDRPVCQRHFTGRLPVIADDNTGSKAVIQHIVVIAQIVLGHDKWLFPFRQHDFAVDKAGISIFIGLLISNIMNPDQNVSLLIHGFQDL